jgi:hypothetical protein
MNGGSILRFGADGDYSHVVIPAQAGIQEFEVQMTEVRSVTGGFAAA